MKIGIAGESWRPWRTDPFSGSIPAANDTGMKASRVLDRLGMWISFAFGVGVDLSVLHAVGAREGWGAVATVSADAVVVIMLLLAMLERVTYETENRIDTRGRIFLLTVVANGIVFAVIPVFFPILLGLFLLRRNKR